MYNVMEEIKERPPRAQVHVMKKLTVLSLSLLLVLVLLTGLVTGLLPAFSRTSPPLDQDHSFASPSYRMEQLGSEATSTPVAFFDFTDPEVKHAISTISFHIRTREGEYTTLEANWNDPQCTLTLPEGVRPVDLGYTLIVYRTTAKRKGEFFAARSDNPTMGTPGTHVQWTWSATGNWETLLIENSVWKNAAADVTFQGFRFDPLESQVQIGETIDFKFMAFFSSREEAEDFDFDSYKATLTPPETEAPETEPATEAPYDWPEPTYMEQETSWLDNHPGTLQYTPFEDGKTVTVTYQINGEAVSYTVPANENYLFGGYAGVDDLGRSLFDSTQVGAYDPDKRQIGLFYFLWHDRDHDQGLFDLQKILDELGPAGAANLNNGKYGSMGVMHWFAEPLYGYYYINDEWVLRKHAELLTNAGVDFLFFDVTNAETFIPAATRLMGILHEFNQQGYDAPQVVFYTNTDYQTVITKLQREIYGKDVYPDTWYTVNNRPVIIAPANTRNPRFTFMISQWPNAETQTNAWPWMDFEWPQRVYQNDKGAPFAINVSIAQHSGTVCFSDSSLKGNYTNRGRSFFNPNGIPSTDPAFDGVLKSAYDAWVADPSLSNQGLNFQAQWDYALSTDAPTILITGWNEWLAGNWGCFVDTASVEFSRDAEMTRGYYFDNYYMQMVANIQKAKGVAPTVVQDTRKAINVTGGFEQWEDIPVTYTDPAGDALYRDADGFGGSHYTNRTGRNDILEAKMTADTRNLYVYVKTAQSITKFDSDSSWMQLYLNTDRKTTGWYGYDFIINHKALNDFTTTVAKYNGQDGAYGFESVGEVTYRVKDNEMMIAIPLSLLSVEGYLELDLEFKWADSRSVYDEMEDFYCDGDAAPLGRMNYIFRNYIPGVSDVSYPDPDSNPSETAPSVETRASTTAPETDADTNAKTSAPSGKGCRSVLDTALIPIIVALGGVFLPLYKKKRSTAVPTRRN